MHTISNISAPRSVLFRRRPHERRFDLLCEYKIGHISQKASLGYPGIGFIQFDDKLQKFYGLIGQSQICSIDTATLHATVIGYVADSDIIANVETGYDADNGKFLLFYQVPIGVSQLQRRIAMFDVATGRRTIDTLFQDAGHEHYVGVPTSFRLQPAHNKLNAIYGKSYTWSLNDTLLAAEQSQALMPLRPGNYRCEVTFFNDTRLKSANYNFPSLGTPELKHPAGQVIVSPNPFHDHCTITFTTSGATWYTLRLVNEMGQIAREEQGRCDGQLVISKGNLPSGIYYYELLNETGDLSKGKIQIY